MLPPLSGYPGACHTLGGEKGSPGHLHFGEGREGAFFLSELTPSSFWKGVATTHKGTSVNKPTPVKLSQPYRMGLKRFCFLVAKSLVPSCIYHIS